MPAWLRSLMKRFFPVVSIALALLLMAAKPVVFAQDTAAGLAAVDEALKPLQGKWEGIEKGREAQGKCALAIAGKNIDFKGADGGEWYKGTLAVNATTEPKQLDGMIAECPFPDFVGKTTRGIYKLEGDTLTLVGRQPGEPDAPKSFEDSAKTRTFVLKKVAP